LLHSEAFFCGWLKNSVTGFGVFSPIGRLLYFGHFIEKYKNRPNFVVTFLHGISYEKNSLKMLGHISCIFSTNLSGHPAQKCSRAV
jgi:hypothetical protein